MRASVMLILLIGFAVIFILRLRTKLTVLAEQIRQLRAQALQPVTYRAHPSGTPTGTREDVLDKAVTEAERLGFARLGEYVEDTVVASAARPRHFVVDAAGTTFGYLAPFYVGDQQHVLIVLMSHELDQQTITSRQPAASLLSRPPFVDMQTLPVTTSLNETIAKHRRRAQLDDGERAFVPVRTFEELRHELDRMRDKVSTWRRAQPVEQLLDADLRSLLGAQYDKLAKPLKRRLV